MTSSCALIFPLDGHSRLGPRRGPLPDSSMTIHADAILGLRPSFVQSRFLDSKRGFGHYKLNESMTWPATPGIQNWVKFPDGPIYAQKTAIFGSKRAFPSVFCTFSGSCTEPGRPQSRSEDENGRWGNRPWSSNRQASQAKLAPMTPQEAHQPPQEASQEV